MSNAEKLLAAQYDCEKAIEEAIDNYYFVNSYVEQIRTKYNACKCYMEEQSKCSESSDSEVSSKVVTHKSDANSDNLVSDEVQDLMKTQFTNLDSLNHQIDLAHKELREQRSKQTCEIRYERIDKAWNAVDDTNSKIRKLMRDTKQHREYSRDMHNKVEQDVTDIQVLLKTRLQALSQTVPIKLAKLTVPIFNGDYLNWNHFRDIFIQLVHNTMIPGAEKMLHLLNSLSGQAKKLVQHIPISSDNYELAWNIIEGRYNNKRLLGFNFVNCYVTQKL